MNLNDVNAEWKKAFIAEQKSLYGNAQKLIFNNHQTSSLLFDCNHL